MGFYVVSNTRRLLKSLYESSQKGINMSVLKKSKKLLFPRSLIAPAKLSEALSEGVLYAPVLWVIRVKSDGSSSREIVLVSFNLP